MAVNIDLSNQGIWNTYGVHGYGSSRRFIYTRTEREPAGFPYNYNSATGYGGVLLVSGQNAYTGDAAPLAYDLACPVECMPDVRVAVDPESLEAVCPKCGSHYNVTQANGAPVEGPAVGMHYALTPYSAYRATGGGYVITR